MKARWLVLPTVGALALGACAAGTSTVTPAKQTPASNVALSYSPKPLPRNQWDEDFAAFALDALAEGAEMSPSDDFVQCLLDHIIDNYTPEQMLDVDVEEVGIDGAVECMEWFE